MSNHVARALGVLIAVAGCSSDPTTPSPSAAGGANQAGAAGAVSNAQGGGGGSKTSPVGGAAGQEPALTGGSDGVGGSNGNAAGAAGAASGGAGTAGTSGTGGGAGSGGGAGTGGATTCPGAGHAVEFDGDAHTQLDTDDSVGAVLPKANTSRTVEMWVYSVPKSWRAEHHLFQFGDRTPREGAFGVDFGDGPYPNIQIYDNGSADTTFKVPTATVKETGWFHLAMVWDAATMTIRGVINGVTPAGATKKLTAVLTTPASKLSIGYSPTFSGNGGFTGKIDEFRIWNVARSDAEIAASMNKQLTGKEAGLVVYYSFDEGTGTTSKDLVAGYVAKFGGTTAPKWATSDLALGCD
ncbi:MAG: LamG domain-containing protein [Polyangiaceae bacterium]